MGMPSLVLRALYYSSVVHAYYREGPIYGNNFGVPGRNASFDYVVVGGGTAGLAVAMRLAENPANTVAVIEAGGFYEQDNGNTSVVPNLGLVYDTPITALTNAYPNVDWGIATTPQPGLLNQTYHYWRGKTLGGSSALNNEIYQRGTKGAYQWWSDLVDDTSYAWEEFLPWFQKSAHYTPPDMSKRPSNASVPDPSCEAFSAEGGPLEVTYINYPLQFGSWAKLAFHEMSFPVLSDFDSGKLIGTQYSTQTIAPDMTRSSSEASYLQAAFASGRQNLIVYPRTLAKRILFDEDKTATGVSVTTSDIPYTLSANRQVILSCGAIHSPQLLMVSGIGPRETLEKHDIPVISSLPGVGQNLWDHMLFPVTYRVNVQGLGFYSAPQNAYAATLQYLANRTGQLTNTGFDYIAWEKLPTTDRQDFSSSTSSKLAEFPDDWPELEFIIADASFPNDTNSYASVIAGLVAPLSRGFVTITSSDTSQLPIFSPNWLVSEADQEVAVASFKRCRDVFATDSIRPILIGEEVVPGLQVQSDEQILQYIKQTATTIYHAACTCKMGTADDPMAVLDAQARVYGVKSLRVVDASSFPVLPPGHPSATIYALAEKIAADILLETECGR